MIKLLTGMFFPKFRVTFPVSPAIVDWSPSQTRANSEEFKSPDMRRSFRDKAKLTGTVNNRQKEKQTYTENMTL